MQVGVRVTYGADTDIKKEFEKVVEMGIYSCQLNMWNQKLFTDECAEKIIDASKSTGVEISGLWAGWTGPCEWNFNVGPAVLGLVPPAYRSKRTDEMLNASAFAEKIGVTDIITHCGFIPENPMDPDFMGLVGALRKICGVMKERGQYFLFETGQETPTTLLRTIEEVGTGNLGINLDTGNLVLYGKANPVDALDTIGKYVRNTHCKDGFYPTEPYKLGKECRLGDGKVDFRGLLKKLDELGYTGALTIEREISGEQQIKDIIYTRGLLENLMDELNISYKKAN